MLHQLLFSLFVLKLIGWQFPRLHYLGVFFVADLLAVS